MTEQKAAEAIAAAVNQKSFLPRVFGYAVISQNQSLHPEIMKALIGVIEAFAWRVDKPFDPIAYPAYALAKHIRDAIETEYGEWPPPLD